MRVHIIDHNTAHRHLIASLVTDCFAGLSHMTFGKTRDDHTANIKAADLVIISGGTMLTHLNPDTHRRLIDTILAHNKPVFGICLGTEALGNYFGAELIQLEKRVSGIVTVRLHDYSLIRASGGDGLPVYAHHRWTVQNLPEDLEVLADSATGVELFRHRRLPVWGAQFHPEVKRGQNKGYLAFAAMMHGHGFEVKQSLIDILD